MLRKIYLKRLTAIIAMITMTSCEDFVEIDAPDHKIVSEIVFSNDDTAISAMQGIYNRLITVNFSNGWTNSITMLAELSSDNLECIRTTNITLMEFQQNELLSENSRNEAIWSSAYNIIYQINLILEGLSKSNKMSEEIKGRLEGEAKFLRAFTYFYLVNLYGEVPLLLTSDYQVNSLSSRDSIDEIYLQIKSDLEDAIELLDFNYLRGERTYVNRPVAMAFLARVYLYEQNFELAEYWSSRVIAQTNKYELLQSLNEVFLKNSREAIWQISPLGRGNNSTYTWDGYTLIIDPIRSFLAAFKLNNEFIDIFSIEDKRLISWISYHSGLDAFYAHKYKDRSSTNNATEYSMVLRLSEQFLIRAEARVMQDKILGAIEDVNQIRQRAGLKPLSSTNPSLNKKQIIDTIIEERRKELFTEWGHRWLDLKRISRSSEILGIDNPTWQDTDVLYPIPETERMVNPNLGQNNGY